MTQPSEGGRYIRDPETKKLTKADEKPVSTKPKTAGGGEKGK